MGIFINMTISSSVTKDEWQSVYRESLRLVNAFPFAERREVPIRGIKTKCLVPTREREDRYGWNDEKVRIGWFTDGDYESLCTAEDYYLPRDLVKDDTYDPDAPDAMFSMLPSCLDYNWNDPRFQRCYELWGMKTQGEPYHMYLLAVACMIESRLDSKAYVYGDITIGQCRKAVEMANRHLDKKIDLPTRCDPERLLKRIKSFPISETEMLRAYTSLYLGNKDADFGNAARKLFSEAAFNEYWTKRLGHYQVNMRGFNDVLNDYLLWGFDLDKLAGYVSFIDKDGNAHYDNYVRRIMSAKLYHKEKDCYDFLKIDGEEERPYGIAALFAQFTYGAAANRKIDRYIPLADIRKALLSSVGDKCDVMQLIDDYLKEDEEYQKLENAGFSNLSEADFEKAVSHDPSAILTQVVKIKREELIKSDAQYDISEFEDLPFYESGDSIHPHVEEQIGRFFAFYRDTVNEDRYSELMTRTPEARCEWLVFQNRSILLRDRDWDKIFGDIMDNPESYARYYPMVRVKVTGDAVFHLIRAITVNDAFYKKAFELEEVYGKENEDTPDE